MAVKNKIYDSGGEGLYVWKAHRLNFHMNPKNTKMIHAWMSTAHICKGYGN